MISLTLTFVIYSYLSRNIWSGNRKWSGQTKKRAIFSPAPSYTVLPQLVAGGYKDEEEEVKTVRVDSQRVCMNREDLVMPEEEDLIERACTYLLAEHRYPDGCSSLE